MTELRRQPPDDRFRNGGLDADPLVPEGWQALSDIEEARHDGYDQGFRRARQIHGRRHGEMVLALLAVFVAGIVVGAWLATEAVLATSEAQRVGMPVEARAEASRAAVVPATGVGASPSPTREAHPSSAALPEPSSIAAITEPPAPIGGVATWYCSATSPCTAGYRPSDLVAAIDPGLGIAKGTRVRVDHEGRTVVVVIVDVCVCRDERLIDLTAGAFARLAPLSVGVIPVSIAVLEAVQ